MSYRTVGTCGNCGGPVVVPMFWGGIYPPTPQCANCKAIPENPHGPKIPMRPAPPGGGGSFGVPWIDPNAQRRRVGQEIVSRGGTVTEPVFTDLDDLARRGELTRARFT